MIKKCMNPICEGCLGLQKDERPLILLGKKCWNCHETKYLVEDD